MSPTDILDMIAKYGPGSIFVVLWWIERTDHQKTQIKLDASQDKVGNLSERVIVLMTEIKGLLSGEKRSAA